jgi:hypothetical protein
VYPDPDTNDNLYVAKTISGSGNIHHKKMWLNLRDVTRQENTKGIMSVAINDWRDYVSVKLVYLFFENA